MTKKIRYTFEQRKLIQDLLRDKVPAHEIALHFGDRSTSTIRRELQESKRRFGVYDAKKMHKIHEPYEFEMLFSGDLPEIQSDRLPLIFKVDCRSEGQNLSHRYLEDRVSDLEAGIKELQEKIEIILNILNEGK